MNKLPRDKIWPRIEHAIQIANTGLDAKIEAIKAQLNVRGLLNSGAQAVEINDCLLKHIDNIYDIIWEELFSYIRDQGVNVTAIEIHETIADLSTDSVKLAMEKLSLEVNRPSSGNATKIIETLDFLGKTKSNLTRLSNKYSASLIPFDAVRIAQSSKNISLWAIGISIILSLPAIVISIISYRS